MTQLQTFYEDSVTGSGCSESHKSKTCWHFSAFCHWGL